MQLRCPNDDVAVTGNPSNVGHVGSDMTRSQVAHVGSDMTKSHVADETCAGRSLETSSSSSSS